jgi:hypothetical protein
VRRPALAAVLIAAAALPACGGGDERLTAEEYRRQARDICQRADRATDRIEEPTRATSASIADYLRRLLSVNRGTADRLAKMEPPEDLEAGHDRAVRINREGVALVQRVIRQLERGGDSSRVLSEAQGELRRLGRESDASARALGVPECAGD